MKTIILILLSFFSFGQSDTSKKEDSIYRQADEIIEMCDTYIEANYIGGLSAMLDYISNNIVYTPCPSEDWINKVYVGFTVEKDGDLSDIKVYGVPCLEMEKMLVGLFDKMPPWSPGSDVKHGAVRTRARIPVQICLR